MKTLVMISLVLGLVSICHGREISKQNYLIGEQAAGMGGAFTAMSSDPACSYYNPAGLAGLKKPGLSVSASVYQGHWEEYEDLLNVDQDLSSGLSSETFSTFPSTVAYALPVCGTDCESLNHVLAVSLLVPDYDHFEGKVGELQGLYPIDIKGSYFTEEETYWAGPSYAISIGGWLRMGLSVFGLVHLSSRRINTSFKAQGESDQGLGFNWYSASTIDVSGWSVSMLVQAGIQVDLGDSLTLGLTLRSPTFGTIYSSVEGLAINSFYLEDLNGNPLVNSETPGYVDRVDITGVSLNQKLPLMIGAGVVLRLSDWWELALDGSFYLPQGRYAEFSGGIIFPKDPQGMPITDLSRAVDPTLERQYSWVLNGNLGSQFRLNQEMVLRLGVFTNFSEVDEDFHHSNQFRRAEAMILPVLSGFGASLGGSLIGKRTTTSFALVYVYGYGHTYGMNEYFDLPPNQVDVHAHTFTVVLAGSANL